MVIKIVNAFVTNSTMFAVLENLQVDNQMKHIINMCDSGKTSQETPKYMWQLLSRVQQFSLQKDMYSLFGLGCTTS